MAAKAGDSAIRPARPDEISVDEAELIRSYQTTMQKHLAEIASLCQSVLNYENFDFTVEYARYLMVYGNLSLERLTLQAERLGSQGERLAPAERALLEALWVEQRPVATALMELTHALRERDGPRTELPALRSLLPRCAALLRRHLSEARGVASLMQRYGTLSDWRSVVHLDADGVLEERRRFSALLLRQRELAAAFTAR